MQRCERCKDGQMLPYDDGVESGVRCFQCGHAHTVVNESRGLALLVAGRQGKHIANSTAAMLTVARETGSASAWYA